MTMNKTRGASQSIQRHWRRRQLVKQDTISEVPGGSWTDSPFICNNPSSLQEERKKKKLDSILAVTICFFVFQALYKCECILESSSWSLWTDLTFTLESEKVSAETDFRKEISWFRGDIRDRGDNERRLETKLISACPELISLPVTPGLEF